MKRRAYLDWDYWGKPVPSFGDPDARLLVLGLAPGAHGANRTGRMFTGDRSGDFLYRSMYRAGFASQESSEHRDDGLYLRNAWISAAGHCAPPDNKPLPEELSACAPYLERELEMLPNLQVVVVLGKIAFEAFHRLRRNSSKAKFSHGALFEGAPSLLCSYHPSQQNTSTGRLTQAMLDEIFQRALDLIKT